MTRRNRAKALLYKDLPLEELRAATEGLNAFEARLAKRELNARKKAEWLEAAADHAEALERVEKRKARIDAYRTRGQQ